MRWPGYATLRETRELVAGTGFEPPTPAYETSEMPFLYRAMKLLAPLKAVALRAMVFAAFVLFPREETSSWPE